MNQEIKISVDAVSKLIFEVRVKSVTTTTHKVTVPSSYYKKLTTGCVTPEKLVEASFNFLLERERNTSILPHFELSLINHYFPEYEEIIKKLLD